MAYAVADFGCLGPFASCESFLRPYWSSRLLFGLPLRVLARTESPLGVVGMRCFRRSVRACWSRRFVYSHLTWLCIRIVGVLGSA